MYSSKYHILTFNYYKDQITNNRIKKDHNNEKSKKDLLIVTNRNVKYGVLCGCWSRIHLIFFKKKTHLINFFDSFNSYYFNIIDIYPSFSTDHISYIDKSTIIYDTFFSSPSPLFFLFLFFNFRSLRFNFTSTSE
jgi:hypothetical protein